MPPGHLLQTSLPRGGSSSPRRTATAGHDVGSGSGSLGLGCYYFGRQKVGILSKKKDPACTQSAQMDSIQEEGKTDTRCAKIYTSDEIALLKSRREYFLSISIHGQQAMGLIRGWRLVALASDRPDPQTKP